MLNLTEALRSLTPKAHTDSTRFNKKKIVEICANLWLFVADKKTPILSIKSYFHLLKKSVSMDFKLDKIGFLTEQANFLVFFLRKITILWGWVFLAMARCQ